MGLAHPNPQGEEGFGLVELVISMAVLAIGLMALVAAFSSAAFGVARAVHVTAGSAVADTQMETYRLLTYDWVGLDTTVATDATYKADAACVGGSTCTNFTPPNNGCRVSPAGSVWTNFPNQCTPTRNVTGADGKVYRLDTYIRQLAATTGTSPQRIRKQVTVVVRGGKPYRVLARQAAVIDCSTAALGSTCP
jgi:type II secretory pathway pseudopilin PulG